QERPGTARLARRLPSITGLARRRTFRFPFTGLSAGQGPHHDAQEPVGGHVAIPAGAVRAVGPVAQRHQVPRWDMLLRYRAPRRTAIPRPGNVNTPLANPDDHRDGVDVLVLAVAGPQRVDQSHRIGQVLDPDVMAPPAGAGVIVVQTRTDDQRTRQLVATPNDA